MFEFLRNEKLNARNFFANDVPPFKRNQFGGTFGGPVRKDKAFFFASFQRTSERSAPGSVTATVPTAAQRRGDFSSLRGTLRDPAGGSFSGNIIPERRLHPASQKFLEAFVPLPNRPDGLLTFSSQERFDDSQFIVKGDLTSAAPTISPAGCSTTSTTARKPPATCPAFWRALNTPTGTWW